MSPVGEGPGEIRRLNEEVVNRIAAGEIVQRPANALKELLENCLDAKSTNIMITVKAGGLKYLQIQDNGCGIRHSDLGIVCERFTTSKLREYEDLREISTYGFRGEALASISHIAHLSILTKTAAEKCAYKASYVDGKLKGPIKACAGNNGTQITVEDLFYNVIARKKALRSPGEEYSHIMEVVGGYAIHNSRVGFTLKKFGEKTDIKTPPNSSVVENVRAIYGNAIARELMEVELQDETLRLKLHGYVTNVNYSHKRGMLLLFINHRLVDSVSIRKAVDSVYATYLPKNSHSFVYLSLELDPRNVDVNVHPTKQEVQFLHEEQIVERLRSCVEAKLLSCNSSRVMYTQARLPGASIVQEDTKKAKDSTKINPNNLVRMSSDLQKIEKFFPAVDKDNQMEVDNGKDKDNQMEVDNGKDKDNQMEVDNGKDKDNQMEVDNGKDKDNQMEVDNGKDKDNQMEVDNSKDKDNQIEVDNGKDEDNPGNKAKEPIPQERTKNITDSEQEEVVKEKWKPNIAVENSNITYIDPKESFKTRKFQYERIETKLTSVKQLRMDVESRCNMNLREILANLIFIGCVDEHRTLIQHSTKLYLCDTTKLTEELFYQSLLYDFQNLGLIRLSQPLPLDELLALALPAQTVDWDPQMGDRSELIGEMCSLLVEKRTMLLEYFSLEISADGKLLALPLLLDGHTPYMGALPAYLARLVTDVSWQQEKGCFDTFCRETAAFYSQPEPGARSAWRQEHLVYPAVRRYFLPPANFVSNGAILQVASLPDLYRVFERC